MGAGKSQESRLAEKKPNARDSEPRSCPFNPDDPLCVPQCALWDSDYRECAFSVIAGKLCTLADSKKR